MNFVHAFWSAPLLNCKFNNFEEQLKITITDYLTSFATIKRNGYDVELYTDEIGAQFLSIINYDKVHIIENTITNNYNFAASFKFCALQQMPLDDILVDGDAFFTKGKVYGIIEGCKSDFLCSLYEPQEYVVKSTAEAFEKAQAIDFGDGFNVPDIKDICGFYNTSVMKFNNQELKDKYIEMYIKNVKLCENIDWGKTWPDIVLEQWHMTKLLKNYTVSTLTPGVNNDSNEYSIKIGFTHLGSAKRSIQNNLWEDLKNLGDDVVNRIKAHIDTIISNCKFEGESPEK